MNQETLQSAFKAAFAVFWGAGAIEGFLAFIDDDALIIDEDNPFVLDKTAFKDHLDFHLGGNWEALGWKAWKPDFRIVGETGLISSNFTLRGKPKDSGFRQRHGVISVVCHFDSGSRQWKAGTLHLSPLLSHIHHASPG